MRSKLRDDFVEYLARSAAVLVEQARSTDPREAMEILSEVEEIKELMEKTSHKKPLSHVDFEFWNKILDNSPSPNIHSSAYGTDIAADALDVHALSAPSLDALTNREREALSYVTKGCSNKDIAEQLGVREITVKVHLKSVFRKLGVSNRTQAARVVWEIGHVDMDSPPLSNEESLPKPLSRQGTPMPPKLASSPNNPFLELGGE